MATQVELSRLEPFPAHASPLDVLASEGELRRLLRDHSEPPTVFFTPRWPPPRPGPWPVLLRLQALSDEEAVAAAATAGEFEGAAGGASPPPSPGPLRLFASGFFLRLRGLPAEGSRGTARPVLPVSLDEVVLGARVGATLEGDDAEGLASKLLELCRDGRCLLARLGEPLVGDRPGEIPDTLVLSCSPVAQGRVTADTAVVLADCGGWPDDAPGPAPPPRELRLCVSDFARQAARLAGGRSLLDRHRESRGVPEEPERRLEVRVTDVRRWPGADGRHGADADARLYVGVRALLRLGLFDGEWVKLRPAGRSEGWRAASLTALRSGRADDDDVGVVSETLWFNLTGGRQTADAARHLWLKRWRRRPGDSDTGSDTLRGGGTVPPPAGELHLRPLAAPADPRPTCYDALLAAHFSVPRLVAPGDVLLVPTRGHPDVMEDGTSWRRRALLFLVQTVSPRDPSKEEEGGGGYLADRTHTSLFMGPPVNSSVPPGAATLWSGECPPGLERAVDAIGRVLGPHRRGSLPACRLLVHGPAGSGKATAVAASSSRLRLRLVKVDCVGVCGDTPAATEARLTSLLERARALQPCVLLLGNLQLLLRPRGGAADDDDARIRVALCRLLRGAPGRVAVVATVREARRLPAGVAAAFVHRVALEMPDEEGRQAILTQLSREVGLARDVDMERLAKVTAGLALGDLRALLVEAGRAACRRLVLACPGRREEDVRSGGVGLRQRDFLSALRTLRDAQSEAAGAPKIPAVRWEDVGGLERVKREVLDTVQLPLRRPQLLSLKLNRTGVLLYGPPGTGKTLLAKAVATECSVTFLSVKGPELLNMYVGQSEENVREVFQRARSAAPCVVFFDELDSLAPGRGRSGDSGGVTDRVVSQLLAELDALHAGDRVFVIGATNRPDLLDLSLLRPGRFDKLVYVGIDADPSSQLQVLRAVLRSFRLDASVDPRRVLERCPAYTSGADLYALCSDAMAAGVKRKIAAIQRGLDSEDSPLRLTMEDFGAALRDFRPSLSPEQLLPYQGLLQRAA